MLSSIAASLRKPREGETRELGFIERSECTSKGIFFYIKSGTQVVKLTSAVPEQIFLRGYTPDIAHLQMGCGMKAVEIPVVFVYKKTGDAKAKVHGELLSLEFVPPSFKLEN